MTHEVINLPAVRETTTSTAVAHRDTDSWVEILPAVAELANKICGTDFVPKALRNNVAGTAAAIMYGREVGLPPMTSLGNVNVINGRPGLSAVIMRAQVLAAGHEIREDDATTARCVLSGRRRGTDYWQTVEYTFEDAKRAGLANQENYRKHPRRMLRARATSELCELMFADVVRGMSSIEDLEEIGDDDATQAGIGPAPARQASTVQRKRKTGASEATAAPGDDEASAVDPTPRPAAKPPQRASSSPPPPLPGEPGYDGAQTGAGSAVASVAAESVSGPQPDKGPADAESGAPGHQGTEAPPPDEHLPEPEHVPPGRPASKAILRAIMGQFRELGYADSEADRTARLAAAEAIIGRPVDTMSDNTDLTHEEARKIASTLSPVESREQLTEILAAAAQAQDEQAGS